jgi:hypothetical protein
LENPLFEFQIPGFRKPGRENSEGGRWNKDRFAVFFLIPYSTFLIPFSIDQ